MIGIGFSVRQYCFATAEEFANYNCSRNTFERAPSSKRIGIDTHLLRAVCHYRGVMISDNQLQTFIYTGSLKVTIPLSQVIRTFVWITQQTFVDNFGDTTTIFKAVRNVIHNLRRVRVI